MRIFAYCHGSTFRLNEGWGGRGVQSVRAYFNFRELPGYLNNNYHMWPLILKCIGEQDYGKIFRQRFNLLPWQRRFRRYVY